MKIYQSVTELVGHTPLLWAKNYQSATGARGNLFAKLEYLNPTGSVKDRVAKEMIESAERSGKLQAGGTVIEPTSGNTGIGIAAIAVARGYRAIIVMPETMSIERRNLIKLYGAEVVLTEGSKGMSGAIEKANELQQSLKNAVVLGQFDNPANPEAHYRTTGVEIYEDLDGKVDVLVAGVGTGGTLTGTGRYLKEKNPNVKIVGVEPASSPVLTKGQGGAHQIQGIGAGFVPKVLDTGIYDEIIAVENERAFEHAKAFAKAEGILVGISAGAALYAATLLAQREENVGKNIVIILPDTGDRYLSVKEYTE
ncbi:MAG: cysteine synthase A [Clostridia bacterium]|nr:cysteine synthase A [Clostridia bacterium]